VKDQQTQSKNADQREEQMVRYQDETKTGLSYPNVSRERRVEAIQETGRVALLFLPLTSDIFERSTRKLAELADRA